MTSIRVTKTTTVTTPTGPKVLDTVRVPTLAKVLGAILVERQRQDAKWVQQNHPPEKWLTILAEEFGEVSKDLCDAVFAKEEGFKRAKLRAAIKELVQTAAVCVAMVESLERNELQDKGECLPPCATPAVSNGGES